MSTRCALMLVVAVGIGLFVVSPALAGPWFLKPGEYATDIAGTWQSSYHYLDENGDDHRLYGGGRDERRSGQWLSEFGWKKKTSFLIGLPFVSLTRMPGSGVALPTTTVMGDALVGFKRSLLNGHRAAAIEIEALLPLGYQHHLVLTHADSVAATRPDGTFDWNVARQITYPHPGDGQASIGGTFEIGTAIGKSMFASGYAGYAYRGSQWQSQVLSGADFAIWYGKSWLFGARYRGVNAGKGDNPTQDASWNTIGPLVTYRIDDHIDMVAGTTHTFSAKNALHVDQVRFGFTLKSTKLNRLQGYLGSSQNP